MTFISDNHETQLILDCLTLASQQISDRIENLPMSSISECLLREKKNEINELIFKIKNA